MTESDQDAYGVDEMCSYAVDLWLDDIAILTDRDALVALLRRASAAGKAEVLGEAVHVFPNDAVTAVLVLSQSHLSIHTWPEFGLANVDLLAYGRLNGEAMLDELRTGLGATRLNVSRMIRATS